MFATMQTPIDKWRVYTTERQKHIVLVRSSLNFIKHNLLSKMLKNVEKIN